MLAGMKNGIQPSTRDRRRYTRQINIQVDEGSLEVSRALGHPHNSEPRCKTSVSSLYWYLALLGVSGPLRASLLILGRVCGLAWFRRPIDYEHGRAPQHLPPTSLGSRLA